MKKYSPYKISNPCEGCTVPLLPNQDFILSLSSEDSEIDYRSDFFELKSKEIINGRIYYRFSQKYDLSYWSFFSKVFLGEVLVCYSNHIGSLHVYLNNNNDNIVTLINPDNSSIKVNSNSIIELVVYDNNDSNWDCNIWPSSFGEMYEQIEYKKLYPNQKDVIAEFPSIHRSSILNFTGPEHHFWFRCSLSDFSNGQYAGKIILSSLESDLKQVVNVNISQKKKMKMFPNVLKRNIVLKKNYGILKKDISFQKRFDSDLGDDCNVYIMNIED